MPALALPLDSRSDAFVANRDHTLALIEQWRAIEARTRAASAKAAPLFEQARPAAAARARRAPARSRRALPRAVDAGRLAARTSTTASARSPAAARSSASASSPACASWSSPTTPASTPARCKPKGLDKLLRAQQIALENKLPFVHLVESAGANLLKYRVEQFIHGGALFCNLARLSAAGLPVIAVVHGSSTAGGAYMTGLADYVIMVRGRARAFLAGPPLLKAATGEIATDEELGGADMHATVSGLAEYVADDDASALAVARELIGALGWQPQASWPDGPAAALRSPKSCSACSAADAKKPVDMRDVIARIVDGSDFLEFKADYGPATVCGHAQVAGFRVGIVTNNGPLDPAGSTKVTHFIQACCQLGHADRLAAEHDRLHRRQRRRARRHDQARLEADPGARERDRAADHGPVRRVVRRRQLRHVRPRLRSALRLQLADREDRGDGRRAGRRHDGDRDARGRDAQGRGRRRGAASPRLRAKIVATFERQSDAFYTSGLLLDDGIIDPRDTRRVLALALTVCDEAARRTLRPIQFGVARP